MKIANIIAWILLIVGGIAWLVLGIFGWNFVTAISGGMEIVYRLIYILVGISALWLVASPILEGGKISLWNRENKSSDK